MFAADQAPLRHVQSIVRQSLRASPYGRDEGREEAAAMALHPLWTTPVTVEIVQLLQI
jgi:hypothetical protein